MSVITLDSPDSSATYHDWQAWLEELRDMPPSGAVKIAIRKASRVLEAQRQNSRKAKAKSREFEDSLEI